MQLKTVLCPVDRSETSARALAYAADIARRAGARLSVIEVIDWTLPPIAGEVSTVAEMPPDVQMEALDALNALVAPVRAAGVATEICLESGHVVKHILARAHAVTADLIVIGTHGRGGFERLALGSVMEKVLRRATCPVLTVGPGSARAPREPGTLFETVLCATDFSDSSKDAVRLGRDLARQFGSRCLVVHVVTWPFGPASAPDAALTLRKSLQVEAEGDLDRLVRESADAGGDVTPIVSVGEPKRELMAVASAYAADLIVMGESGRGAIDRAILGSTTYGVIRQAECPVLTVRDGL